MQQNETLLFHAIKQDKISAVDVLLKLGADVNWKNNNKLTALHLVAKTGNEQIANLLLNKPTNLNVLNKFNKFKSTPLDAAARAGSLNVAKALLEKGANVNKSMPTNWSPLHTAVKEGNEDMVELILQYRPNLHVKATNRSIDPSGESMTPKEAASKKGFYNIVKILENQEKKSSFTTKTPELPMPISQKKTTTGETRPLLIRYK